MSTQTQARAGIAVANAPVSYGAFEITVGHDPNVPDGISVLDQVAAAGYAGIDLGPVGYLGRGTRLGELLTERGLGLAGGYLELPYADPDALEQALAELDALLATFDAVLPYLLGPPPRPTLADAGSPQRRSQPGRSAGQPSLGLDAGGWRRFAAGLARVVGHCRDRGYEPTFHPETGTYVEAPWEIEEVLDRSDIGLCLETGHMMMGGGDPVAMLRDWGDRVNHVHLKDGVRTVMAGIVADGAPATEIWSREAFCELGHGDLDVDAILDGLRGISFGGWLDVEQDIRRLEAVHHALPDVAFIADANQGFTREDCLAFVHGVKRFGGRLALLEQPLAREDLDGLAAVRHLTGVPVAADESVRSLHDVMETLQKQAADYINIKIMKSGLLAALDMAAYARAAGLRLMIGGMVETRIAMGCSFGLVLGRGGFDVLDLDTPLLLATDPVKGGYRYEGPKLQPWHGPGLDLEAEVAGTGTTIE